MTEYFSKQIGDHVFAVRPFLGARAEATARVLLEELGKITSSRLGLQGEAAARDVNGIAFGRIEAALLNSDFVSVQQNAEGEFRPLTQEVWKDLGFNYRLPVLAFIGQAVYAPETLGG